MSVFIVFNFNGSFAFEVASAVKLILQSVMNFLLLIIIITEAILSCCAISKDLINVSHSVIEWSISYMSLLE